MGLSKFWQDVIQQGKYNLRVSGPEVLVARGDVLTLLREHGKSLKLIRAEAFKSDGSSIVPLMECIFDAASAESYDSAVESFISLMEENSDWKSKPDYIELITAD